MIGLYSNEEVEIFWTLLLHLCFLTHFKTKYDLSQVEFVILHAINNLGHEIRKTRTKPDFYALWDILPCADMDLRCEPLKAVHQFSNETRRYWNSSFS